MNHGSESSYLTRDMSLAVFLNLSGHAHQRLERRAGRCFWVFRQDEALGRLVQEYTSGSALVEPKQFMLEVASIREEMFDFLDGGASAAG